MKRPICLKCQMEMRIVRVGVTVVEMFLDPPEPYRVWNADVVECPMCKNRVATGFSIKPIYHHNDPRCQEAVEEAVANENAVFVYEYIRDSTGPAILSDLQPSP